MEDSVVTIPLTPREAASGILGSISLACWIFLLVPQLIENYKCGSAEAVSLAFLTVWLIGDVANLCGAVWAGLVPVIIAIAVYFCIADGVLIAQCLYYNILNARRAKRQRSSLQAQADLNDTSRPLLDRGSSDNLGLPGSRRRSSTASLRRRSSHRSNPPGDTLSKILEEGDTGRKWVKNTISVLAICVIGFAGWTIAWQSGVWSPTPIRDDGDSTNMAVGAQILGYLSAVCYLGARIPQIAKNYREQSCEGLSLLFFILSLMGNVTYGAGILFHSTAKDYFLTNLPWLIGSLGTMVEDVTIFVQFRIYSKPAEATSTSAVI